MSDYELGEAPLPKQMATETWCNHNAEEISEYIDLRVRGWSSIKAMRRIFGEDFYDSNVSARVNSLEGTRYYRDEFDEKLKSLKIDEVWTDKIAVHRLLQIVNDESDKGSTRLRAIQELNILIGITIVDENGKTRKGNRVGDFYKDIGTEEKRGESGQLGESNYGPSNEQLEDYRKRVAAEKAGIQTPVDGQPPYESA